MYNIIKSDHVERQTFYACFEWIKRRWGKKPSIRTHLISLQTFVSFGFLCILNIKHSHLLVSLYSEAFVVHLVSNTKKMCQLWRMRKQSGIKRLLKGKVWLDLCCMSQFSVLFISCHLFYLVNNKKKNLKSKKDVSCAKMFVFSIIMSTFQPHYDLLIFYTWCEFYVCFMTHSWHEKLINESQWRTCGSKRYLRNGSHFFQVHLKLIAIFFLCTLNERFTIQGLIQFTGTVFECFHF